MGDAGFFKGTSADQDSRFSNKEKKLLKSMSFPPEFEKKVDMKKVKLDVIKPWISNRITELLGFEDEVVIDFAFGLLEEENPDPKRMQINLTGFLEKNTQKFVLELWQLLLSAQESFSGIPALFLEQKKKELMEKQEQQKKVQERQSAVMDSIRRRKEAEEAGMREHASSERRSRYSDRSRRSRSRSRSPRPRRSYRSRSRSPRRYHTDRYRRRTRSRSVSRDVSRSPTRSSRRDRSPSYRDRDGRRFRSRSSSRTRYRSPVSRHRSRRSSRSPERRRRSPSTPRRRRSPTPMGDRRRSHYSRSPSRTEKDSGRKEIAKEDEASSISGRVKSKWDEDDNVDPSKETARLREEALASMKRRREAQNQ